jgi:two-component system OmpR family response regulator
MPPLYEAPHPAPAGVDEATAATTNGLRRVLLVDDERDALDTLELALAPHGYLVETAINGADAIERARQFLPDAVVTDLLMPVVDGIGLAKALRADAATAAIKIVMCSGVAEGSVRALFSQYDAFLTKPLEIEDLKETLAALLRRPAR